MVFDPITALIVAGASAGGSALNFLGSQSQANQQNRLNQAQLMLTENQMFLNDNWAHENYRFAREQYEQAKLNRLDDIHLAREFAQSGVQWRSEDARRAGLHPLAALGMQGFSPPTTQIGSFAGADYSSTPVPDLKAPESPLKSLGAGLSQMGQNIGEIIQRTQDEANKDKAMVTASQAAGLRRQQLENKVLEKSLSGGGPRSAHTAGFPNATMNRMVPGQGDTPDESDKFKTYYELFERQRANAMNRAEVKESEHTPSGPGGAEMGEKPAWKLYNWTDHIKIVGRSQDYAESQEDNFIGNAMDQAAIALGLAGPGSNERYSRVGPFMIRNYGPYSAQNVPDYGFHPRRRTGGWVDRIRFQRR